MTMAVILCGDRLDHDVLAPPDTTLHVVDGLCQRPEAITGLVNGHDRLVVGTCPGTHARGPIQRAARAAGLDALGVGIVEMPDPPAPRLEVLLAAAIARARVFAGSRPDQVKVAFAPSVSRRTLLRGTPFEYEAAPAIDTRACEASRGCRVCVDGCPAAALSWDRGAVEVDLRSCTTCGQCLTACPTGAMENPAWTPAQLHAEVGSLLAAGGEAPTGIAFRCRSGTPTDLPEGWWPVAVPCTSMVSPGWMLAPFLLGAAAVAVVPCSVGGCTLGDDAVVHPRLSYGQALLHDLGLGAGRLQATPGVLPPRTLEPVDVTDPFTLGRDVVVEALARAAGAGHLSLSHPAAPHGIVAIDPVACTGCGACAAACPTGALLATSTDEIVLQFDPGACTACGQCVQQCPEQGHAAITLVRHTDMAAIEAGPRVLFRDHTARCEQCGGPVAPQQMLARLASLLDDGDAGTLAVISRLCLRCRGVRDPS